MEASLKKHHNTQAVTVSGLKVEVRNGDFNGALRKFKKKVQEDGLLQDLRQREHYEKPSDARKKARAAARSRWLKQQSKDQLTQPSQKRQ